MPDPIVVETPPDSSRPVVAVTATSDITLTIDLIPQEA